MKKKTEQKIYHSGTKWNKGEMKKRRWWWWWSFMRFEFITFFSDCHPYKQRKRQQQQQQEDGDFQVLNFFFVFRYRNFQCWHSIMMMMTNAKIKQKRTEQKWFIYKFESISTHNGIHTHTHINRFRMIRNWKFFFLSCVDFDYLWFCLNLWMVPVELLHHHHHEILQEKKQWRLWWWWW